MEIQANYVLLDIEGTVSDIHFVRNILFPYSAKKMKFYVTAHQDELSSYLQEVPGKTLEDQIAQLLQWIEDDAKIKALKSIQAKIWKYGFEKAEFESPIYDDVIDQLNEWREKRIPIGIYSSGAVNAQKMFFKNSDKGDLLNYFSDHFDLEIGGKKEASSYVKIAASLKIEPQNILFLSDIEDELLAAKQAGLKAVQIVRPGTKASKLIHYLSSFSELVVNKNV